MKVLEEAHHHFTGPEIEAAGRFVGKQDAGVPTNARARTTPCCSLPDSSPARCVARFRNPISSNLANETARLVPGFAPVSEAASSHSRAP
jgi:hypothetical protein